MNATKFAVVVVVVVAAAAAGTVEAPKGATVVTRPQGGSLKV
mgnify:CR=1 FL=1